MEKINNIKNKKVKLFWSQSPSPSMGDKSPFMGGKSHGLVLIEEGL